MESERIGNFNIWSRIPPPKHGDRARHGVEHGAEHIPVTMYRQGSRYQVVGAMRFGLVARTLYSESARKGASLDSIVSATNRPKDSGHITEIVDYVQNNLRGSMSSGH